MKLIKGSTASLPARLPRLHLNHFALVVEIVFYPAYSTLAAGVIVKHNSIIKRANVHKTQGSLILFEYCEASVTYNEFIICREKENSFENLPKEIRKAIITEIEEFCQRMVFTEREVEHELAELQKEFVL